MKRGEGCVRDKIRGVFHRSLIGRSPRGLNLRDRFRLSLLAITTQGRRQMRIVTGPDRHLTNLEQASAAHAADGHGQTRPDNGLTGAIAHRARQMLRIRSSHGSPNRNSATLFRYAELHFDFELTTPPGAG